uniref:C2H2 type zinc-finger protein n=1 Tax=Siphoviridae sp. ctxdc10 TaxID=2825740 RepID=A0A8S5TSB6_9CAUD|nr:MAG TPA: C2H2 type zinc-finger protein [Siphoviridae sp. ctxdc10]DAP22744.1 MAG TPA: C2H2 type zinc-finger protein [Caudoviricetes sp.]DAU60159.1 MAG TPA: C2H2 type zinc-finger protein [Caudoviricetes sp.]
MTHTKEVRRTAEPARFPPFVCLLCRKFLCWQKHYM